MSVCPAIDPILAERAVWEALRDDPRSAEYHRQRDAVYTLSDPEDREAAFVRLHAEWFIRLDVDAPIRVAMSEQAAALRTIRRCLVAAAGERRAEGAELYVDSSGARSLLILLRPAVLATPVRALALLRGELMHIADMLDPAFLYEPRLPDQPVGPARDRLVQERYRILWNCSVEGRLARMGRLAPTGRERMWTEFRGAFGFLGAAARSCFERLFDGPRPGHPDLVAMANDPASSSLTGEPGTAEVHRCPLCGFPTRDFEPDPETLPGVILERIRVDEPAWRPERGLCRQCADLYRARPLSDDELERLPGRPGRSRARGSAVLPIILLLLLAPPTHAGAAPAPQPGTRPAAAPYTPAEECSSCHAAIHDFWSGSPHALSATNPVFLDALERAAELAGDGTAARRACVWCHAPTTLVTGDLRLEQPISREGITCDFCHTVKDVDLDKGDHPFILEPGDVKRGPFLYSEPVGHGTAYSQLHHSSPLICAACHEFRNAGGVAVLSTYSDWKEGPYPARGVPCQDCHMALVPGSVVAGGGKEKGSLRVVNLHRIVGGSSAGQLARGLELKIDSMARSGSRANLSVIVTNVAAGHPVPGGLSTKALLLTVGVESADGTLKHVKTKRYRREIKDERGRTLRTVHELFLKGASVGVDNRIRPRESRMERFSLPIPPDGRAVVARLEYENASDPERAPVLIRITEIRRELSR